MCFLSDCLHTLNNLSKLQKKERKKKLHLEKNGMVALFTTATQHRTHWQICTQSKANDNLTRQTKLRQACTSNSRNS